MLRTIDNIETLKQIWMIILLEIFRSTVMCSTVIVRNRTIT